MGAVEVRTVVKPSRRTRPRLPLSPAAGFIVGIVGSLMYVAGTMLPWSGSPSTSILLDLFRPVPHLGLTTRLAAFLSYYGGPLILLAIAIHGLRVERRERPGFALFAAASIPFLSVARELADIGRFGFAFGSIGARAMDLGICLVFVGGAIAATTSRPRSTPLAPEAHRVSGPGSREGQLAEGRRTGLILVFIGVIGFIGASLLPYSRLSLSSVPAGLAPAARTPTVTLARLLLGNGVDGFLRQVMNIYGAALVVGTFAALGLLGRRRGRWSAAVCGAASAWSVRVAITLVAYGQVRLIGLWLTQSCILVALLGGVLAVRESQHPAPATVTPTARP